MKLLWLLFFLTIAIIAYLASYSNRGSRDDGVPLVELGEFAVPSVSNDSRLQDSGDRASPSGDGRTQVIATASPEVEPEMTSPEGPEEWEVHYRFATIGQLFDERLALQRALLEESEPYFKEAWAYGLCEPVEANEEGGRMRFDLRPEFIERFRVDPETKTALRATMPREGHESTYLMHDKANWLLERENNLRAER